MLDRCCANDAWRGLYPRLRVKHEFSNNSDHIPLVVVLQNNLRPSWRKRKGVKPFRFETLWLHNEECKEIIQSNWSSQFGDGFVASR